MKNLFQGICTISYWKFFFSITLIFGIVGSTHAAPLTYSVDTTVSLSSPAINYTILANSVADSVVVNAGGIVVTMSSSTGGSFVVSSASRDIGTSAVGTAGSASKTCASGVATITISQSSGSATYSINPDIAPCLSQGVGGGGYIPPAPSPAPASTPAPAPAPTPTPTPTPAPTSVLPPVVEQPSSQATRIAELQAILQSLILQVQALGVTISPELLQMTGASSNAFSVNLSSGATGVNVVSLQTFLIGKNIGLAAQALANVGATGKFGGLTKAAVIEYQKYAGITPANGSFGPKTRGYANTH